MRFVLLVVFALSLLAAVDEAEAIGRRRRARSWGSSYVSAPAVSSWGSTPQAVADSKARYLASRNAMFHPGGGYGGGAAEGVGAGMTPAQALGNCCFSGQRPLLGQAVYQGSNGMWYAVRIFR